MPNSKPTPNTSSLEKLSVAQLCEELDALLEDMLPFGKAPVLPILPILNNKSSQRQAILSALKQKLGPRGQGHLVMAQINGMPGNLKANAQKIMMQTQMAEAMGVDAIVFPEMALMGYPIGDVIQRHPFLVEENIKWLHALAQRTGKTRALVGFVEPRTQHNSLGKPFYNALAILGEGQIEGIVRKCLLPDYGEFYDARTFEPSPYSGVLPPHTLASFHALDLQNENPLIEIHGHTYGISICEDIWNDSDFFTRPLYARDPIAELAKYQPDVLINASASPSRSRKEQMKHNMLSHVAGKYKTPLVYVNQVGAVDELSFDGASRVYDSTGKLTARAHSFRPQFMVVNPLKAFLNNSAPNHPETQPKIYPLPLGLEKGLETPWTLEKTFDAHDTTDLDRTYETLVQGIKDYFKKTGFQRAILGLSGGLDSSVCVALLVDALGAESVVGVSMPSRLTSQESQKDAQQLADNLGIALVEVPISDVVNAFESGLNTHGGGLEKILEPIWGTLDEQSFARDNVQAISRATVLRQLSNNYRALPIATSDKSEYYLGYATVNGDMSGALSPLGDVPKTKVRALAHWINKKEKEKNKKTSPKEFNKKRIKESRIPEQIIAKPSGAELAMDPKTGKSLTAEEALMPYEFADEIIWRIEALHQSKTQIREATFQWEKRHTLSQEQKDIWIHRFFWRMTTSVFKWWIAPPVILVEGNGSLTKTDYRHPITAYGIQWDGTPSEDLNQHLDAILLKNASAPLI